MQDNAIAAEKLPAEYLTDPYTFNRRLREEEPVREVILPDGMRVWLVTRYADTRAALADPRLGKDSRRMRELFDHLYPNRDGEGDDGALGSHMLNSDPPDHERLRRLVMTAFTSRRIELLRPRIEEITQELIAAIDTSGPVDLLDAFAFPLPITVICELLGMSLNDQGNVRRWTNLLLSGGETEDVQHAMMSMIKTMQDLIADKRDNPGDDMLSALVQARDEDDRLGEHELSAMVFLLLVAGHETTVNLIGNGVLALVNNPAELASLRADMSLLPGAIEEFLRYEGPLTSATYRFALEDMEIGGVTVPKDDFVILSLSTANRDPRRFGESDRFDIHREPGGHLAFGHGIHYCLGAPLARLEAEIAFTGLLNAFPSIELAVPADELRWRPGTLIRGLRELPLKLA